ncbi:hypothetical protein E1212_21420 [Jiangella ureilytica]|uniref:Uncharacterized protein n=1 Tax=Jiangella ureilytica TaxID=2530374 RepID=A0A4R4RG49_9ACTN|nr:hypothetical protein [Jiangella ureilytica]TDC48368.1 hypothetical protein E1212_21420 [Jiangella ureilytica]
MIDLTGRDEVAHLVEPLRRIDRQAETMGLHDLVVGAAARDMLLHAGHGVPIRRMTTDLDIAVAVEDWRGFEALRSTFPHASGGPEHRVTVGAMQVDLVPFGGVERTDRTIAWPPAGDWVMSAFGLAEALTTADETGLAPRSRGPGRFAAGTGGPQADRMGGAPSPASPARQLRPPADTEIVR